MKEQTASSNKQKRVRKKTMSWRNPITDGMKALESKGKKKLGRGDCEQYWKR